MTAPTATAAPPIPAAGFPVAAATRKDKRKTLKKLKRKQIRQEAAIKEREEEEARSNDPEEQLRLKLREQEEAAAVERERRVFEERERILIEAAAAKRAEEEAATAAREAEEERKGEEMKAMNGSMWKKGLQKSSGKEMKLSSRRKWLGPERKVLIKTKIMRMMRDLYQIHFLHSLQLLFRTRLANLFQHRTRLKVLLNKFQILELNRIKLIVLFTSRRGPVVLGHVAVELIFILINHVHCS